METSAGAEPARPERRPLLTGTRILIAALVVVAVGLGTYVVWHRSQGVHDGDTYSVVLTRHGCAQADPLFLDGWAWTGILPTVYGDGPVPGRLHVDSVDRRTATFVADAGWTTEFRGNPSGVSDLSCAVAG